MTQLTASALPRTNILHTGFCNPTLIPLLFFTRDISSFCNWDPPDGSPSVRVQIERGGEPNEVMRAMLANYFNRGPFMGDPIGTVLKHHSLTTTSQTEPGTDPTLTAVMGALMNQGAVGENDKIVLLGMGFPGTKRDQDRMMKFLETEATARAFLNLWSRHLSTMIADADPSQMEEDAFNASTGTGRCTEAVTRRRVMFLTMLQASVADMIQSQLQTIAVPSKVKTALSKLLTTDQGTFSESKVMAKLRRMMEELFRLRVAHKHSYEYAQLAVLARLRTWASVGLRTDYDMATLFSDRPEPALAKVLEAFQGPTNPITTLQSSLKVLEEYKKSAAPVIATMKASQDQLKSMAAKGFVSTAELKAVTDKIGNLVEENKKLQRIINKKADKGGGNDRIKDGKRKKKPAAAATAAAAAAAAAAGGSDTD